MTETVGSPGAGGGPENTQRKEQTASPANGESSAAIGRREASKIRAAARIIALRELHAQGESNEQIAAALHMHPSRVSREVARLSQERRVQRPERTTTEPAAKRALKPAAVSEEPRVQRPDSPKGLPTFRVALQADAARGMDEETLMRIYGITRASELRKLLEPHLEDFKPAVRSRTENQKAALSRAIAIDSQPRGTEPGLTFAQLRTKYGLSIASLVELRKMAGVAKTGGRHLTEEEVAEVARDVATMTPAALKAKYGERSSHVRQARKELGLTQQRGQAAMVLPIFFPGDGTVTPYEEALARAQALYPDLTEVQFSHAASYLRSPKGGHHPVPKSLYNAGERVSRENREYRERRGESPSSDSS